MSTPSPEDTIRPLPGSSAPVDWRTVPAVRSYYMPAAHRPSGKSLALAGLLFLSPCVRAWWLARNFPSRLLTMNLFQWTSLCAHSKRSYQHPSALLAGLPFAVTLMTILLAHELGHFFACRHHRIRTSYPFFIPAPTLIGTFGAFILLRSPIRNTRALFDVGASGPFVGFLFAVPALVYGVLAAKVVPGLADPANSDVVFGVPLILQRPRQTFSSRRSRGHPAIASSRPRRLGRTCLLRH